MTIYDLPALVEIAYTNAVTRSNIQAGFKSIGIYTFDSQIFSDSDFLPGYVVDHDLLLPAAGEAETTSNKTPENLLKISSLEMTIVKKKVRLQIELLLIQNSSLLHHQMQP